MIRRIAKEKLARSYLSLMIKIIVYGFSDDIQADEGRTIAKNKMRMNTYECKFCQNENKGNNSYRLSKEDFIKNDSNNNSILKDFYRRDKTNREKIMFKTRENFKLLIKSKMPISRKLLLIAVCIDYRPLCILRKVVK